MARKEPEKQNQVPPSHTLGEIQRQKPQKLSPERLAALSGRIYTPESFDERMNADSGFRAQVAGCTTIGFDLFVEGMMSPGGAAILPYSIHEGHPVQVVPMAFVEPLRDSLIGMSETIGWDYSFIKENREYAALANVLEAFAQYSSYAIFHELAAMFGDNIEGHEETVKDFLLSTNISHRREARKVLQQETALSIDDLLELAQVKKSDLPKIAKHLEGREGVQIVYGPPDEFLVWLKQHNATVAQDIEVDVTAEIPERFILAIIPLGPTEQRELGVLQ